MAGETDEKGKSKMSEEKNVFKREWLLLVILIIPFILIAIYWNVIPEQIPLQWSLKGNVNRYGDKMSVFDAPLINIIIAFGLYYLPRIDPRKQNYDFFPRAYRMVRLTLAVFFFAIFLVTISPALGITVNTKTFVQIGVPLLFLIIGNFLRSFRQNFFAGIRTPWTLDNPEIWNRTHKLASWIWTVGSLAIILIKIFVGNWEYFSFLFTIYIVLIFLIPIVMSYVYYKRLPSKGIENNS
jgi:uncharacterized membrane protein